MAPTWLGVCLLVLVITLSSHNSEAVKASEIFQICKRNDPNLNECVRESIMQLRPTLKKGMPQIRVGPLDPMVIPQIGLTQGSGPVSIQSDFKDLHIKGFSNVRIDKVNIDLSKYQIDLDVYLDWFYTWGDYDIKGQILILPISGNGPSWSNYTDVRGKAIITGHEVIKKNKSHFSLDNLKVDLAVGHATIHMDNLFGGNKVLGDTMNQFMSDNWQAMYSELKPVIDEAVSSIFRDLVQKVFDKFPLDELFPL